MMEQFNFWINIIISILAGLATAIPLIVKLIQAIQDAVKAKNWEPLFQIVLKYMEEAEQNYVKGSDKKKYVMDSIESIKNTLNYEVDMNAVSDMIDSICKASKKINTKSK